MLGTALSICEEVILEKTSLVGMLQALNKCQLSLAHTPMLVFVETHTVVVGVGRQTCHTILFWGSHYDGADEFRLSNFIPCPGGFGTKYSPQFNESSRAGILLDMLHQCWPGVFAGTGSFLASLWEDR